MTESTWEKRPLFLQWVEDAKAQFKLSGGRGTNVEVAAIMGLKPTSLKKYLSKVPGIHNPGPDALQKLGAFLNRDYRILFDGPDVAPSGISPAAWAEAEEEDRIFANTMFYLGQGLYPDQRKAIIDMVKAGKELHRARKNKT